MSGLAAARRGPAHRHNTRSMDLGMLDSRIDFSCLAAEQWSEPCFVRTAGSQTFPAQVCVRSGTQIMDDADLYASLKGGILGLFRRFTEDLVLQKTPKLRESSQFSAELLEALEEDYTAPDPKLKEPAKRRKSCKVTGSRKLERFHFLLVKRLDGESPRIFAGGYIFSHGYGDLLYIRHVASEVEQSNMGGALMAVAMNAARDCGHTTAILNFNPRKAYLQKVYERMGFENAKHKRIFVDEEGRTLFDKVHSWGMFRELGEPIGSVRVGVVHAFAAPPALSQAATRESSPYLVGT